MLCYLKLVRDAITIYINGTIVLSFAVPLFFYWAIWRLLSAILLFPAHVYQAGDDVIFQIYQRVILFLAETITSSKVTFYGDIDVIKGRNERFIFISNHQTAFDWIVVNMLAERIGMLGHIRYVIKNSIQSLPIYGFYFYQHACIYVNRMQFNFLRMKSSLAYLQNTKIPSGIVIFPEGTRFDVNKENLLKESHAFADSHNLPRLDYVLIPRTKGFVLTVEYLRCNIDAVYNVTILFESSRGQNGERLKAPSLAGFFTGYCREIHIHIERFPIEEVPKDEEQSRQFLYNIFVKKNELIKSFFESTRSGDGVLPSELSHGVRIPLDGFRQFICVVFAAITLSLFLFTHQGLSMMLKIFVLGTIFGYSWLGMNAVA